MFFIDPTQSSNDPFSPNLIPPLVCAPKPNETPAQSPKKFPGPVFMQMRIFFPYSHVVWRRQNRAIDQNSVAAREKSAKCCLLLLCHILHGKMIVVWRVCACELKKLWKENGKKKIQISIGPHEQVTLCCERNEFGYKSTMNLTGVFG